MNTAQSINLTDDFAKDYKDGYTYTIVGSAGCVSLDELCHILVKHGYAVLPISGRGRTGSHAIRRLPPFLRVVESGEGARISAQ